MARRKRRIRQSEESMDDFMALMEDGPDIKSVSVAVDPTDGITDQHEEDQRIARCIVDQDHARDQLNRG